MLDIGWTELFLVAVIAIVVIGPKDLPRAMRVVGQWSGKMKRMARDFQGQFNEALREAELDGVKKDFDAITKTDPMRDVRSELNKTTSEINKGLREPAASVTKAAEPAKSEAPAKTETTSEPAKPAAAKAEEKPAPAETAAKAEPAKTAAKAQPAKRATKAKAAKPAAKAKPATKAKPAKSAAKAKPAKPAAKPASAAVADEPAAAAGDAKP